jgi:hypothetical protein
VVTSIPLVSRTRATFRKAEFGFLGVEVYTRVQTPRFCGQLSSAGLDVFQAGGLRPLRTSWLKVGTVFLLSKRNQKARNKKLGNQGEITKRPLKITTARI